MTFPCHNDLDVDIEIHSIPRLNLTWIIPPFNTLRSRQIGRYFAEDIFKYILFNENLRILTQIPLKCFQRGQLTINQHWFRERFGAE